MARLLLKNNFICFSISFFFLLLSLPLYFFFHFASAQSSSGKADAQVYDYEVDEFDDDSFDIKTKNQKLKISPLYQSLGKEKQDDKRVMSNNSSDQSQEEIKAIEAVLEYGTYQEQTKIFLSFIHNCKFKSDDKLGYESTVEILQMKGFFEKPFDSDETLVLAVIDFVHQCDLVDRYNFIMEVLTKEFSYRHYQDYNKNLMKTKSWMAIKDFYSRLPETDKANLSKLVSQYYRYERYHNNDIKVKRAVIDAAGVILPVGFNRLLRREYSKETDTSLKNIMIQTIGLYQDIKDINFLDEIIAEEEGFNSQRWVAVVAFTNYSPNPTALRKVQGYTKSDTPEIAVRAYYVLSFYNLDLKFFIEAAKNNNENIRVQAIQAMKAFPIEEVKDILEYKSTRDFSSLVRDAAKEILEAQGVSQEGAITSP